MTDNLSIDTKIENWFKQLEQDGVILKTTRNGKSFYHLNSPIKFIYPKSQIDDIRDKYHEKHEKGGYILFQADKNMTLRAVKIEWIDNKSDTPENSYTINTDKHKEIEKESYLKQLFPVRFHTHPMDVKDINRQSARRLEIIDTSDADKWISYDFPFVAQHRTVILPDVLIVWDINYLNNFFIGIYNGLISPIGFKKHRIKVTEEFNREFKGDVLKWVGEQSDFTKGALITGTVVTLVAAICNPHISAPLLKELKNQNPMLAIGAQKENTFFGFTDIKLFSEFSIQIPKVTKDIIDDNEQELKFAVERLREEWAKKNKVQPLTYAH